jgi:hypothetical protein
MAGFDGWTMQELLYTCSIRTEKTAYLDLVSSTMGTGSFPGVKQTRRGFDHTPPSSAEVKEGVELYLYTSPGLQNL